jgi:uncharacterized NAD(P)/FAD-binding protein YdhS
MTPGLSVVIVGGGASAVYVAVALEERSAARELPAPSITVVGREFPIGRGLAYGHADAHHRLNSPAGKMSISALDDTHFVRWANDRGVPVEGYDFVPRNLFGDYVEDAFRTLESSSGGRVRGMHGEVVDVTTDDGGAHVTLADGSTIEADVVVLAVGNPPPATWATGAGLQIDDPWATGALDGIESGASVLLIGTGLTMVDVATSLARRDPDVSLTATSRHLLMPGVHLDAPAAPGPGLDPTAKTLAELSDALQAQLAAAEADGQPWQAVIDGLRPRLTEHWLGMSVSDRREFVSHFARRWDVRRHRMAPSVWSEVESLLERGTLTLAKDVDPKDFDVVVFCTGPTSVLTPGWNPVTDALAASGRAVSEPLGLGPAADESGALIDSSLKADGRLLGIGHALRGALWETTAIGEIRTLANRVADRALDLAAATVS